MQRGTLAVVSIVTVVLSLGALATTRFRAGQVQLAERTQLARELAQGALARGAYSELLAEELPPRLRGDRVLLAIRAAARDSLDALEARRDAAREDSLLAVLDTLAAGAVERRHEVFSGLLELRRTHPPYGDSVARYGRLLRQSRLTRALRIHRVATTPPDPGGGVHLKVVWTNRSPRVVDAARFWVVPLDGAGRVPGGAETARRAVEMTGPIHPGRSCCARDFFFHLWSDRTIRGAELEGVELIYQDGSRLVLDEADLALVGW